MAYLRTNDLSKIPLAEYPIVSETDLISYDWDTHTLHLRRSLWFTVRQPGVHGVPFAVVVEGVPIYLGAFWTEESSVSTHVPVILWDHQRKSKDITIQWAYPTSKFGKGADPRANQRLKKVLKELGKLKISNVKEKR